MTDVAWLAQPQINMLIIEATGVKQLALARAAKLPGSRRLQHEIHMQRIERENGFPRIRFLKYAGFQQGFHVTMYRRHVAPDTARGFADGHASKEMGYRCLMMIVAPPKRRAMRALPR